MAKNLYVGGLPYQTTEGELKELFAAAGEVVKVSIIVDRESGRNRGFAFVEMADDDAGAKAIEMYNGYNLEGRSLVVNEARPKPNNFGGGGGGGDFNRRPRY